MINRATIYLLLVVISGNAWAGNGVQGHDIDQVTDRESWSWNQGPYSLRLKQLRPEPSRAFFQGRGFGAPAADTISRSCVFQTIVSNSSPPDSGLAVILDLAEWSIDMGNGPQVLILEQAWQRRWEQEGVAKGPRIAMHWSLFPTRQEFMPGDYNWGMITFGPEPGVYFDLSFNWQVNDVTHKGVIKGLRCALDR